MNDDSRWGHALKIVLRSAMLAFVVLASGCEALDSEDTEAVEPPVVVPVDPPEVVPVRIVGPISEITPAVGILGQKLTVTIKLAGEKAGPGSEVLLGLGVEVLNVVPIAGGLVAEIEIAEDAIVGARDLTVVPDEGVNAVAAMGFTINPSMVITPQDGKAEQGGLVRLAVASMDGRPLSPLSFTLEPVVDPGAATLLQLARGTFTTTTGSVVMLGDPLVKPGPVSFTGVNDPDDAASASFFVRDAVTVTARTPTALVSGTPASATLAAPLATAFYSATLSPQVGEGLLVDANAVLPGGSTLKPVVYGYPATGKSDDLLDIKQNLAGAQARVAYPVTAATTGFFVVVDQLLANSPTAQLSFDFRTHRATIIAEAAGAHPVGAPQALGALPGPNAAIPGRIVTGNLGAAGETDVYVLSGFPAGARDVQISITSDAELEVLVDTSPTFNADPLTIDRNHRAGSGITTNFVGANRYIQVNAVAGAAKPLGSYTLGVRAVN